MKLKIFFLAKRLKEYKHIQINNAKEANIKRIYQKNQILLIISSTIMINQFISTNKQK